MAYGASWLEGGYASDLFSGAVRFESLPEHRMDSRPPAVIL
jgi:hypothetical protein